MGQSFSYYKDILSNWFDKINNIFTPSLYLVALFFLPSVIPLFLVPNVLEPRDCLDYIFLNFAIAYIFALIVSKANRTWKGALKIILFAIFFIFIFAWNIIDTTYMLIYEQRFSQFIANSIVATNLNEASEFLQAYLSTKVIVTIVCEWICIIIVCYLIKRYVKFTKWLNILCLVAIVYSVRIIIRAPEFIDFTPIGKSMMIANATKVAPDLHDYLTHPAIDVEKDQMPNKIVIIVGESFARNHSDLYGYDKPTTPHLKKLQDSEQLYVFTNVTSPACTTMESFMRMFTTYPDSTTKHWYECHKLPEILNVAGYYQKWISNQGKVGTGDGVATRLGQLCDESIFNDAGVFCSNFVNITDENMPNIVKSSQTSTKKSNEIYYVHLIGSHFDYSKRYPKSHVKFKQEDYMNKPIHQRKLLADYDNSISFNDSIVSEIMQLYSHDEAIVIYLSDHGQDVYASSDDYTGHGKTDNAESVKYATQIPFLVYITQKYRTRFPEKVEEIQSKLNDEFNTTNLIYFIMDIAGVRFASQ